MQRGVYSHSDKLWFKVTTQRSKKKKAERKAAAGTVSVLASCTLSVASYHLLFIMPVLLLSTAKWQLIITVLMKWGLIKHNEIRLYGQEELSCGNTAREQGEGVSEWRLCETDEPLDCALFSLPAPPSVQHEHRSIFIIRGQRSAKLWRCCSTSPSLFQRSSDVFIYSKYMNTICYNG